MPDVVREWHRLEFLSPGEREQQNDGSSPYVKQTVLGYGYYVVEDNVVVALVTEQGHPLKLEDVRECRVVGIERSSPFASPPA